MNQQSSKKILFNKSTLFSLKAELLKKQEEVLEKKQLPQNKVENFKPPTAPKSEKDKKEKVSKKSFKDGLKAVDVEELEACRKAKAALEKKTELYDHLADGVGSSQLADRFLVDFQSKKQEEIREAVLAKGQDDDDDVQAIDDDADGWTEFTDCLGRTRKCHQTDLALYREKDEDLKRATLKEPEEPNEIPDVQPERKETPILVQTTNDYLQSLRDKWEEKERELVGKDRDIHYQDLLFDEARIHGVGYYSFSTNEKERRKQMDDLKKQREDTLKSQKQAEEVRKKREEVIAARVKAARARQRARAGLAPEEPEEDRENFTTKLLEFLTKQRDEADLKAKEETNLKKEKIERERQKLREAYVREWDMGKDGIDEKVKKFREMTQEEYVDQQRDKRIDEFAPLVGPSSSKSNYSFDDSGSVISNDIPKPTKTWSEVRPRPNAPLPLDISLIDEQQKGLYYSSKQHKDDSDVNKNPPAKTPLLPPLSNVNAKRDIKYKNFVKSDEPTPIVNELSDDDDVNESVRVIDQRRIEGTEIAPPPTYDYYGPVPKKVKHQKPFDSNVYEAFEQGAKSLEVKSSSRQLSKDYDFTFG